MYLHTLQVAHDIAKLGDELDALKGRRAAAQTALLQAKKGKEASVSRLVRLPR